MIAGSLAALLFNCTSATLRFPATGANPAAEVTFNRSSSCDRPANLSLESGSAGPPTLGGLASRWSSNAARRISLARPDSHGAHAPLPRAAIAHARPATPCEGLLDAELLHALGVNQSLVCSPAEKTRAEHSAAQALIRPALMPAHAHTLSAPGLERARFRYLPLCAPAAAVPLSPNLPIPPRLD